MGRGSSKAGNGGNKIKSVTQAKSLQEVADFMDNNYNIRVNTESLKNVELNSAIMAVNGITRVIDEFPEAADYYHEIQGSTKLTNAFAFAKFDGIIAINPNYFGSEQNVRDRYNRAVKSGFHPAGTTAAHISSHEAGHVLERALIDKWVQSSSGGAYERYAKLEAWNKGTCASKVISEAAKRAKKTPDGKGKVNSQLISDVSGYAKKNRSETLAECVADYAANGSNAKPLSREVWSILKRELG